MIYINSDFIMAKNMDRFYDILYKVAKYDVVSDVHIKQDRNIRVRLSSGDVESVHDTLLSYDDIYWFAHDILSAKELEQLLDWEEVDWSLILENIRFRVNLYKDAYGIRAALRKIAKEIPTMEEIGLDANIKNFLNKNKWLILVTWPTGSGKSTTLASMINYINNIKKNHIITLEDPIEFEIPDNKSMITQRDVGKSTKSWKSAIKYSLRQDPDVIMVGEMRDIETISSVLTLVETWHLVFSTLHTINAVQTISRIIDAFPWNEQNQIATQLSLSLELIISQQLIPLKSQEGRKPAREILINNNAVANNIRKWTPHHIDSIIETSVKDWMQTMDYSLAQWVVNQDFSKDEVIPKVKSLQNFYSYIKHQKNKISSSNEN